MSLTTKWKNPSWDPNMLNAANILQYFCDRSNPFYNNQCNNEKVMMSKFTGDITSLQGEEYVVYHAQDPILFIVCKQKRKSSTQVVPLSYYYIVNGEVMQAPDLASLINARMQTTLYHMNETFHSLLQQVQHHPSSGNYSWSDETSLRSTASNNKLDLVEEKQKNFGNYFHTTNMTQLINEWAECYPCFQPQYNVMMTMNPPVASGNTGRHVSQTPSVGSCTPRSSTTTTAAGGGAGGSSDLVGVPPVKKMRL